MAERRYVAGIDVGGTKIRVILLRDDGERVAARTWDTDAERGPEAVLGTMADGVLALLREAGLTRDHLVAAGAGVAGPLNTLTGVAGTLPNLPGWAGVPVQARLEAALGVPVALGNDANVAALGEQRYGAGRGVKHMVMITLGTGVGGGVIIDGRLLEGAVGAGGEIGHMVVTVDGAACMCGRRGCLEAYAGGASMQRAAAALLADPANAGTTLAALTQQAGGEPSPRVLEAAADQGDPLALGIFQLATSHLAAGIVSVVHLFNPQLVLFGGGLVALRHRFIDAAAERARQGVFPLHAEGLRFAYAELGEDMGALGAAALALDRLPHPG